MDNLGKRNVSTIDKILLVLVGHANMKAKLLLHERQQITTAWFVELKTWQVPKAVKGATHLYKYSLAYVVKEIIYSGMTMRQAKTIISIIRIQSSTIRSVLPNSY